MNSGKIFELNRLGTEIWEMIAPEVTIGAICQTLGERYPSVKSENLAMDVMDLMRVLAEANLVGVTPEKPLATTDDQSPQRS
jgi:hypothetical protein